MDPDIIVTFRNLLTQAKPPTTTEEARLFLRCHEALDALEAREAAAET